MIMARVSAKRGESPAKPDTASTPPNEVFSSKPSLLEIVSLT